MSAGNGDGERLCKETFTQDFDWDLECSNHPHTKAGPCFLLDLVSHGCACASAIVEVIPLCCSWEGFLSRKDKLAELLDKPQQSKHDRHNVQTLVSEIRLDLDNLEEAATSRFLCANDKAFVPAAEHTQKPSIDKLVASCRVYLDKIEEDLDAALEHLTTMDGKRRAAGLDFPATERLCKHLDNHLRLVWNEVNEAFVASTGSPSSPNGMLAEVLFDMTKNSGLWKQAFLADCFPNLASEQKSGDNFDA